MRRARLPPQVNMVQICVTRLSLNSSDTFLRHLIRWVGLLSGDALLREDASRLSNRTYVLSGNR